MLLHQGVDVACPARHGAIGGGQVRACRRGRGSGRAAWWYAVPGVCGCAFVFGMPVAFGRLGVFQTLLALIAAQLVLGLCWDRLVEGRGVAPLQLVGAVVVLCGAILVLRR